MKSRDLQPILFHPAKISFKIEGQIKSFPDKRKIKEFIVTKLLLYEMLKGLIQQKRKIKPMNNKMVINTNLSTIESKKQTKNRDRIMDTESISMVVRWEGCVGQWVKR